MIEVVLAVTLTTMFLGLLVAILVGVSYIQKYEDERIWRRIIDKKFILVPGDTDIGVNASDVYKEYFDYISKYLISHDNFHFFWNTVFSKYTDKNNAVTFLEYSDMNVIKLKLLGIPHEVTTLSDIIGIEVS